MKVGFIGFGEVSYNLSKIILSKGIGVMTSLEGRSDKTRDLAGSLDIDILDSFEDVAREADVLISANSPSSALAVAVKYGSLTDGIFLDLNNISPQTAYEIANYLSDDHFIDAAIMGTVKSNELNLFFSGKRANKFKEFLKKYSSNNPQTKVNITVVGDKIGAASALKVLRSSYTKGVSALLIETFEIAEKFGLSDDLWDVLVLTEGDKFLKSSKSRIENSYKSSKRKYEEMEQLIGFLESYDFEDDEDIMLKATRDKFASLKNRK
jgi:3-hydroxyisobutyrate dehydrogenase-like beta-hydroxyacid dehydrogenase